MVQLRYYELVGKRVVTTDHKTVGRITDLLARAEGDALVVNALLVGPSGLLRRIGFKRFGDMRAAPVRRIPWVWVTQVTDAVYLSVPVTEIGKAGAQRPDEETTVGAAGRGMRQ